MPAIINRLSRTQITHPILCPRCSQPGVEVWEENDQPSSRGLQTQFISRSEGFYERITRTAKQIEVVCERCGAVLPE